MRFSAYLSRDVVKEKPHITDDGRGAVVRDEIGLYDNGVMIAQFTDARIADRVAFLLEQHGLK